MRLFSQMLALLLAVTVVAGCGSELTANPAEPPTPTPAPTRLPYDPDKLQTVERRNILDAVTGRAVVEPKLTDELFFRRDGRIGAIEVSNGDEVKKGQVIARLEQTDLQYQIGLAQIDLDLAELQEAQAREAEASELEIAVAAKAVERAELELERLETERASLEVTAPYAGRISNLELNPGEEVRAYTPMATIVGTEELVLLAEFSGSKASRITTGLPVKLEDFFDDSIAFSGTIAGQATAGSTKLVVDAGEDAPDFKLGDSFKATVVLGQAENALAIPAEAVKTIGERRYVLLVDQGELQRVYVETGIESEGVVEIVSGLEEGQQVSAR